MNEIVVIYPVSELDTLTVDVSQPDGSDRDIGVALSDAGHLNIYLGSSASIVTGDIVKLKVSGVVTGDGGIYQPEVNTVIVATDAVDAAALKADAITKIQSGLATEAEVNIIGIIVTVIKNDTVAIRAETDLFDGMIIQDSSGNQFTIAAMSNAPTAEMDADELHSALDSYSNKDDYKASSADFVTALMADTGFTAGGSMTVEKLYKITAAWIAGNWRVKPSNSTINQLLDADDAATVILEMSLSQDSPFRTITVL